MIMPDDAKKGVKVMCPSSPSRNAIILLSVRKEEQSTKREREREKRWTFRQRRRLKTLDLLECNSGQRRVAKKKSIILLVFVYDRK